jgi:hypothetical protein
LWSNGDINRKGKCLEAWETTCKPKNQGGLGIIDIKSQNNALLMKHLDKFYNHTVIPWVTLLGLSFTPTTRLHHRLEAQLAPFGGTTS